MRAVQRPPTRAVATTLKRSLKRFVSQEHEPSARAARSILADEPHEHYPAFVSRPYVRHGRVWLSKPSRMGWYYVLPGSGAGGESGRGPGSGPGAAAICVGHAGSHRHASVLVQSADFAGQLLAAIEAATAARGRSRRRYSFAVVHAPELMLLLLWLRERDRSRYWVLEPSHPDAPRGVLISPGTLQRLATRIYHRFAKKAHAFW